MIREIGQKGSYFLMDMPQNHTTRLLYCSFSIGFDMRKEENPCQKIPHKGSNSNSYHD